MRSTGAEYEVWVQRLLPGICEALGIDLPPDAAIRTRSTVPGHYQSRHEVDLLVETEGLLVVECKDRSRIPQPARLDAYWSFAEVAAAHPTQQVLGIFVSSSPVSPATQALFGKLDASTGTGTDFIRRPANLVRPVALLSLPARTVCGWALLYQYMEDGVAVHILQANRPAAEDAARFEHILLTATDLTDRLYAALSLLSVATSAAAKLKAGLDTAIFLLHIGLPSDALGFARAIGRLAKQENSKFHAQNAYYVEELALLNLACQESVRRPRRRPGLWAMQRLEAQLDDLTEVDRSNVRSVLGAWHGIYDNGDGAVALLARARAEARWLEPEGGAAYSSFLADLRSAEIAAGAQRAEWLEQAGLWLPRMTPRFQTLASPLLEAANRGENSSILAVFPSTGVEDVPEADPND